MTLLRCAPRCYSHFSCRFRHGGHRIARFNGKPYIHIALVSDISFVLLALRPPTSERLPAAVYRRCCCALGGPRHGSFRSCGQLPGPLAASAARQGSLQRLRSRRRRPPWCVLVCTALLSRRCARLPSACATTRPLSRPPGSSLLACLPPLHCATRTGPARRRTRSRCRQRMWPARCAARCLFYGCAAQRENDGGGHDGCLTAAAWHELSSCTRSGQPPDADVPAAPLPRLLATCPPTRRARG